MHYVYKYEYGSEIIYIGKTDRPLNKRLNQHGKRFDNIPEEAWPEINQSNISYITLVNETMADVVESELIRRYKPKYNIAKTSEWSGIEFIEPKWKPFRTKQQERDLLDKVYELEEELGVAKKECDKIKKENKSLKERIFEMRFEQELNYVSREKYEELRERFDSVKEECAKELFDRFRCKQVVTDGKTFFEVLEEYKNGVNPIMYISVCYDCHGDIVCEKKIFTLGSGSLYYEFSQANTGKSQGCIYNSPNDKTKLNYSELRNWVNRGSNIYYSIISEDTEI